MPKKQISLHDFLIAKIRSASQKWPETYKIKERVRIEVEVEYNKEFPDIIRIRVPETECKKADGTVFCVPRHVLTKKVHKPARNGSRVMYVCEHCKRLFFEKDWVEDKKGKLIQKVMIAVDHVQPIVDPTTGFVDWNTYFARMFPGPSGLQILCNYPGEIDGATSCHAQKTKTERGIAAERVRQEKGLPPKTDKKPKRRK